MIDERWTVRRGSGPRWGLALPRIPAKMIHGPEAGPRRGTMRRLGAVLAMALLSACTTADDLVPTASTTVRPDDRRPARSPGHRRGCLPALRRQRPAQVASDGAVALRRARHRRLEIPDHGRLGRRQELRHLVRLHQGDRGRRPRRRQVHRALAQGQGGGRAARRLSLLLFLPDGRGPGALVHPPRAARPLGAAAGARHGMEPAVADLQAEARRPRRCAAR